MRRPVRRILTPAERASMEANLRDHMIQSQTPILMMNGEHPAWVPGMSNAQHPQASTIEARRIKKALDEGTAHDLTKHERRTSDKEIRQLEEEVSARLIPQRQYRMADDGSPEYRNVVSELVKQGTDKAFAAKVERLKNLKREREPDNPDAGNIEKLRRL